MAIINKTKNSSNISMDMKVINNIKALGIDMINTAGSGHPGIVLGAAPIIYRLYSKHLVFDYNNPNWINRDRFVMSAGHGSALLYSCLFMSGFNLTIEDLKNFRKYNSITPGHPEVNVTPGVDASTGPLGQGFATAVGMAIAEAYLNQKFKISKSSLIDHYTYVLASDGDIMEGISYEAGAIAGNLGLGKLIVLYDSNKITLDGETKHTLKENVLDRFKSLGWDTHLITDPYDFESFDNIVEKAKSAIDKPSIIEIKTVIGKDSKYQNTNIVHGKPLLKEDIKKLKKKLGIRDVEYTVLSDAFDYMKTSIDERNNIKIEEYNKEKDKILGKLSDNLKKDYEKLINKDITINLEKVIVKLDKEKDYSGRELSSKILNELNKFDIMCVSTDTSSSTKVYFEREDIFTEKNRKGKNLMCGVRELGASAIMNGLLLMGIRCVTSTFLSFSNYMIPSIRMNSLMKLGGIYIFTHDTVLIGEDGPTHQPIEQIEMLRSIPGVIVFRPCDVNEMIGAYKYAFSSNDTCVIVVSKEILSSCENTDIKKTSTGGYLLKTSEREEICLIASGSEVKTALELGTLLDIHMMNSRVVSMPSIELFEKQKKEERQKILPPNMKKVVIEFSSCQSYYKFLNNGDIVFNISDYIKSGSKSEIISKLSYTPNEILDKIVNNK